MARTQTDAAERTAQNQRLTTEVSAELGHPVSVRAAERHRRQQKQGPPAEAYGGFIVRDREVEYDPEAARRVGQVLGKVRDFKALAGGLVYMTIETSDEFIHTGADARRLSEGRTLLITLDVLGHPG